MGGRQYVGFRSNLDSSRLSFSVSRIDNPVFSLKMQGVLSELVCILVKILQLFSHLHVGLSKRGVDIVPTKKTKFSANYSHS